MCGKWLALAYKLASGERALIRSILMRRCLAAR